MTTLGVLEAAKNYLQRPDGVPAPPVLTVLIGTLPWWIGWALLVPAILWFARRVRLDEPARRVRAVGLHLVAAVLFTSFHIFVFSALLYALAPDGMFRMDLATFLRLRYFNWIFTQLGFYAAIVAVIYALEFAARYRRSELAAERLRHHMAEARLQALQMELNPHFLFNTLNAIAGLIRTQENATAVAMVARLADLLRATLDRGAESETTLAEELALLELYLDVERCRFGERLQVSVSLPPDLRDARVPTFFLQPIVENAIRHGIARHPGAGTVGIDASARDDVLTVRVRNAGPPPTRDTDATAGAGVGLPNTEARLRERYGERAGVRLDPLAGGGALATLWLPLELRGADSEVLVRA